MSKHHKSSQNKNHTQIVRSFLSDTEGTTHLPRVVMVPGDNGKDKEGLVVFSRNAIYKKPSFL
ncbi:hypothetical protein ACE41H_24520 [Paenibacillus enshidis]|uniref:Uncharacterized protein n=1 Tax=Paenibacillus enshidis TaxID=1458439 RepID=A0ABV5B0D5_9BACL